jgi:endoglucanase
MPDGAPRQYRAAAFDTPELEVIQRDPRQVATTPEFQPYQRLTKANIMGCAVFFMYILALGFYLWVRITKTLDLGPYLSYGIIVLIVEMLGSTTVVMYGVNLLLEPVLQRYDMDPTSPGRTRVKNPYHVRVLVPCYKESLDILRRTIMAAYDADLPAGCSRTIYLCDDGKDPKKRKWVDSLGSDVVYGKHKCLAHVSCQAPVLSQMYVVS